MEKAAKHEAEGMHFLPPSTPAPLAPVLMMAFWMLLGGAAGIRLAQSTLAPFRLG